MWSSGEASTYTHWDGGEPNDAHDTGEDCGSLLHWDIHVRAWNDLYCATELPFICESLPTP